MTDSPEEIWLSPLHNNPSFLSKDSFAWFRKKNYDDDIKYVREDKVLDLITKIAELEAEVARCHERLEIDHQFVGNSNPNSDRPFLREEIPYDQRGKIPDGIDCRDETIKLLDARVAKLELDARQIGK